MATFSRSRMKLGEAQMLKGRINSYRAGAALKAVESFFAPKQTVLAHCDLPCGVYDPAQAKIEALSVKACMEKYAASSDADFKSRSVAIKDERSHQVKEHLWVLWTDYFKPNHFEAYPQLHTLFNEATKLAGAGGSKGTNDVAVADKLIKKIDEISEIFWATKK